MAEEATSKYFILHLLFKSVFSKYCCKFYTYKTDLQLYNYKCVLSHIVLYHVSVIIVIVVFYNNNTINTPIIVQKCMIKPLGVILDFLRGS